MKLLSAKLKTALILAPGALMSSRAFAGTLDSSDAFYTFYTTVNQWVSGALGTGLAITMLLLGAAIGVAKNSPMPALTGVAGAAFLHWGPDIIRQIMASGAVL
jgi:conjugal transfer pilus assembly protein TraA